MATITANELRRMLLLQKKWDAVLLVTTRGELDWVILSPLPAKTLAAVLRYIADVMEESGDEEE